MPRILPILFITPYDNSMRYYSIYISYISKEQNKATWLEGLVMFQTPPMLWE